MLALRLAAAADADVGEFFQQLAAAVFPETIAQIRVAPFELTVDVVQLEGVKCLFGPLLRQARLAAGLSQDAMLQKVQYDLRNIGAVEKGRQEPGVMLALGMVTATGADVRMFFDALHALALKMPGFPATHGDRK
jgi:DNA-binding XRE family transcriptional regulator